MTIKDACKQLNERCKGVDILSLDPKEILKAEKFVFNAGKTTPKVGDDYSTNY
ncbi:MAG: hypothetical protein J6Y02_11355 [Pseudobutyrivibrio sp.]|nr:hypothetical protein [Pseudobutyrivibrio sp.]